MGISSLGGLSSLGSTGSLGGDGGTTPDVHLTVDKRVMFTPTSNRCEISYQGEYSDLVSRIKQLGVGSSSNGDVVDLPDGNSDSEGNYGPARISSAVLSRMPGGRGKLTVTVTQTVHAASFGIDWTEVSKPIRTWRADLGENAPDLDKIRTWEEQRDGNPSAYYALKIGSEDLEGNTRKLAGFISKGIENYSRYAPVFTISLTVDEAWRSNEGTYAIGTVATPQCPWGWTDAKGRTADDFVSNILNPDTGTAYEWLLVKSTITPNGDGTHQWNLAWQGADSIENDLYSSGS